MPLRPMLRLLLAGLLACTAFLAPGSLTRDPSLTRAAGPTNVSGTISSNTTWALANSPYIVTGSVLVSAGVTLTIQPGVTVKFDAGKSLQVDGTLVARGTSGSRIAFTSSRSSPARGDWGYIYFTNSSADATFDNSGNYIGGSVLEYCDISYGGGNNGMVYVAGSAPFINQCTVKNGSASGVHIDTGGGRITYSEVSSNAGTGVYINNYPVGVGPNVTVANSIVSNNGQDGIFAYFYSGANAGVFTRNTIANNQRSGLRFSSGIDMTVSYNTIDSNGSSGINLDGGGCTTTQTYRNLIIRNSNRGISLNPGWCGFSNTISRNVIANNQASDGSGLYIGGGGANPVYLRNNAIVNNTASSGAVVHWSGGASSDDFLTNTVAINTASSSPKAVLRFSGNPVASHNNLFNSYNTYEMYIDHAAGTSLTGTNNWWGTSADSVIQARLFDWNDDSTKGLVNYSPYLASPDTDAPISPPGNVTATAVAGTASVSWTANPEYDLAGYKIYYGDHSGYPYSNSIDVGNVTNYSLSGLTAGMYYAAVTAYDNSRDGTDDWFDGNESWFSAETLIDLLPPTGPSVSINNSAGFTGSSSVTLSLSAQDLVGVTAYYVSESSPAPASGAAGWNSVASATSYSGSGPFDLSSGDGTKTVYVWYKDAAGNVSSAATASITLDTTGPSSSVASLAAEQASTSFPVAWSGSDTLGGSGVKWYDVQYRDGPSGQWTGWLTQVTTTTATFAGQEGHTYYFRSRAQDNAGNWEAYPTGDGDASTTIKDLTAPASAVTSIDSYSSGSPSAYSFRVSWSGSDAVSGVASYDVQYKDGAGGTWTDWITQTISTSAFFTGTVAHTYYFQSRARDLTGNVEAYPGGDGDLHTETTPPSSAVAALSPYQNSTSFAVYWSGSDASGIRSYDVEYKDGASGAWTDWITATAAISGTFSGQDGHTYYFQARARDVPGNLEAYPGGNGDAYTTVDTTLPSGSLWVNGGALGTTAVSVTLGVLANGSSHMAFSNDGLNFTDWEAYGTSKQWVLAGDDGSKAVHVKFKDLAGNVSAPYSTTVDLATALGQEAGISVNDGALYTNKVTVTLTLPAAPGTSKMMVSNEGDLKGAQWEPYAAYKAWAVTQYGAYVIPRFVYVKYKDLAGNVSSTSIDDIVLDVNAPTGSVSIEGTGTVTGTARMAATAVTLRLSADDDVSGVGGMMLSNSPAFSGASWEPLSASKSWSLESGGKVYVAFKDKAGNASPTYAAALSGAKESLPPVVLGTVHPKTGGQIASAEAKATVAFPPGAVAAKAEVTLVPAVESNLQGNTGALKSAGKFLTLTAKAGETSLTSVSKPYTITVGYTAADVAGMDESSLGIYWWNGSAWQKELTSRVDTAARTVSATLDHLSAFALLGESSTRAVYLPLVIKSYGAGW